ncbi:uncharacterized protein LOC102803791 [Saccoglossus kowalevskii]|uniref:Uncharacterized protein LOC102803791 n=1 Tax=Saccoglossus kowalevskii TaxID=10224 RepID=A0ABM0MY54_SACKO|nr:PREDICTED: uncharacterized protein LOC102803791 [Saccoglossus kowalevskii]
MPSSRKKKNIATLGENIRYLAGLNITPAQNTLLMEGTRTRSGEVSGLYMPTADATDDASHGPSGSDNYSASVSTANTQSDNKRKSRKKRRDRKKEKRMQSTTSQSEREESEHRRKKHRKRKKSRKTTENECSTFREPDRVEGSERQIDDRKDGKIVSEGDIDKHQTGGESMHIEESGNEISNQTETEHHGEIEHSDGETDEKPNHEKNELCDGKANKQTDHGEASETTEVEYDTDAGSLVFPSGSGESEGSDVDTVNPYIGLSSRSKQRIGKTIAVRRIEDTWTHKYRYDEPQEYPNDSSDDDADDEGWSSHLHCHSEKPFTGPEPGPNIHIAENSTPLDAFHTIFAHRLMKKLRKETNKYAEWKQNKKCKKDVLWYPVTDEEMKAFLGIVITMGVDPKMALNDYWSTTESLRNEFVAKTMSRNRFKKIMQYFHCNDADKDPANISMPLLRDAARRAQPLYKVAPVMDEIMEKSRSSYNLHRQIAIDEAIVGYKEGHGKSRAKGFKVHVMADAVSSYVGAIEFMTTTASDHTRTDKVTLNLCVDLIRHIGGRNHILYTNNFYTSPELATTMLNEHAVLIVGSTHQSRIGFPTCLRGDQKNPNMAKIEHLERGKSTITCETQYDEADQAQAQQLWAEKNTP